MKNYYVYAFKNPLKNNQYFYIGKGKGKRYKKHFYETISNTANKHKFNTIQQILNSNLEVGVDLIEENLSEDQAYELETLLITHYGRAGIDKGGILTNICLDARPPNYNDVSEEKQLKWSKNISEGNKRSWDNGTRFITEAMKISMAKGRFKSGEEHPNFGKNVGPTWIKGLTAETDERVRAGVEKRIGQKRSNETKEKMSQIQKLVQNDPVVKERKSKALMGRECPTKGRPISEEHKKSIGEKNKIKLKGRKRNPESIKKMMETRLKKGLIKNYDPTKYE
ncbi:MAG: hypothetical protein M0R77_14860 [Gammaproteobacteria bacterium]|nr:hypothetical protein [Gammaproteobacteria bacterium]